MKLQVENLTEKGVFFSVEVPDNATVSDLKKEIREMQEIPAGRDIVLVLDKGLDSKHITNKEDGKDLAGFGFTDRSRVYLQVFESTPTPAPSPVSQPGTT